MNELSWLNLYFLFLSSFLFIFCYMTIPSKTYFKLSKNVNTYYTPLFF